MGKAQGHSEAKTGKALQGALALCLGYMLVEVVGGLMAGSLALLADAGHMLTDAFSLSVALFAHRLASKPPNHRLTFGYFRAEILAAVFNGATLLALGLVVAVEAVRRLLLPRPIDGQLVLLVALPGLAVNLAMARILHRGAGHNLNVKAALLHVLADTLGSLQVLLAGALIWGFDFFWADGLASLAIALLLVFSAFRVLKEASLILMEGAPAGVQVEEIRQRLLQEEGVLGVHDLHVWLITSNFVAASLHLVVGPGASDQLLWRVHRILEEEFSIAHTTIQVEKAASSPKNLLPRYPEA
jgi:cobalt-zinc-cadmium efflux system protein